MAVKLYLIFCSHCSYKKLTDGSDLTNLVEVKTCKDCGGSRQFKCPDCGYLMRVSKASQATKDSSSLYLKQLLETKQKESEQRKKELQRIARQKLQERENEDGDKVGPIL